MQAPFPEHFPDLMVHVAEYPFANTGFVVVRPASKYAVKMANDVFRRCRFIVFQPISQLLQKLQYLVFLRSCKAVISVREDCISQKVKAITDFNLLSFLRV